MAVENAVDGCQECLLMAVTNSLMLLNNFAVRLTNGKFMKNIHVSNKI